MAENEEETKSTDVVDVETKTEETPQEEEVKEQQMEFFLVDDFETIKKLLKYTSFPSSTLIYQMPNKASSYVDGTPETAGVLMNTLLDYQREEEWRVEVCDHASEWRYDKNGDKEKIGITVISPKNNKQYFLSFSNVKQVIVVPDMQSVTFVPESTEDGDLLPNMIVRFIGLVQHRFFKCVLVGEDDPEAEGKRLLNMKFEALNMRAETQVQ